MQDSMISMASGGDKATTAFNQLGLTWDDLEGKSPAEQMELIGQRLAAIEVRLCEARPRLIFSESRAANSSLSW